ncbi:MAG: YicC family protein [Bacteroidetes bacterium]|nr:YicC family protein [Bacteroidota bacterium]
MIKSMTGFGKHVAHLPEKAVNVEIKTLNSKQLDIHLRIPNIYKEKEGEIRQQIGTRLERGKVELTITVEETGDVSGYSINKPLAMRYVQELKELANLMEEELPQEILPLVMRFPEVFQTGKEDLEESEWKAVGSAIDEVLQQVDLYRSDEGIVMAEDFRKRVEAISDLQLSLDPLEVQRSANIRDRLDQKLAELIDKNKIDSNRFEQELIYYLEKIDITEERVRLNQHCGYFLQTLDEGGAIGRKLGFITQEMGREINTIGSKANDADIQKTVVLMKDELEKIKEQLYNIL